MKLKIINDHELSDALLGGRAGAGTQCELPLEEGGDQESVLQGATVDAPVSDLLLVDQGA